MSRKEDYYGLHLVYSTPREKKYAKILLEKTATYIANTIEVYPEDEEVHGTGRFLYVPSEMEWLTYPPFHERPSILALKYKLDIRPEEKK